MAPSTEHKKTLKPTPGEKPCSTGPGHSSSLLQPESKHKAKKDSSVSWNKLDHTSSPHVHQRSSFSACEGGSWGTTETEGGVGSSLVGEGGRLASAGLTGYSGADGGPRQAAPHCGDCLVLNNNGLIVDWCRWGWPQRQGLALAQGNGFVGPAGSTLGF